MKYLLILLSLIATAYASENKLGCENVIKFSDHQGETFLSFMEETVKPTMDSYVKEGYKFATKEQVRNAFDNVSSKVRRLVVISARNEENLFRIAEKLEGKVTNLYDLPGLIASIDPKVNRYKLATFFGLASCAGAIIEFAPEHIAYNIHYGTGERDKDNRTGRSFGEGIVRDADDASDKNYLKDLQEFGEHHKESSEAFYRGLIKSLANSDSSEMLEISDFGKLVLTDFLAVFTAEQARNLMDNKINIHWDAALLEVTLLGAFHSGQEKIKIYYKDRETGKVIFTDKVHNQTPGCSKELGREREARMYDYWQFSASTNPSHCKRSGINITKREFRKLSEKITKYEIKNNPELVNRLVEYIGKPRRGKLNIFNQLSKFFINGKTPKKLMNSDQFATDFVKFLDQVKNDAKKITALIEKGEL